MTVPSCTCAAVMSMPRLAWTDNLFCAMQLPAMKIPVFKSCGAYWERGLDLLLTTAVNNGYDWVLTIDYDTVFNLGDVNELMRLAHTHSVDAIFAMQLKREENTILCEGLPGEMDFSGEVTRCKAGHFGFTLIRCAKLKVLPKPWLWSHPDPDSCEWEGKGTQDADMGFWSLVNSEGWRVFQANHVRVGHLQRVVTWPGENGAVIHQYLTEYEEKGKPQMAPPRAGEAAA